MPKWASSIPVRVNVTVDVRDVASGQLLERSRLHNLVVLAGRNLIRDLLHGDAVAGLTHFGVGTSATAVAASDTALGAQVLRDTLTQKTKNSAELIVTYYLASGSANGNTLREAGLFNAGAGGSMYARVVLASAIVKTSAIAVTFTWTLGWSAA